MSDRQNKGSPQCPRQHRETHSLLVKAALHTKHNSWRKYTGHVTFTRLFGYSSVKRPQWQPTYVNNLPKVGISKYTTCCSWKVKAQSQFVNSSLNNCPQELWLTLSQTSERVLGQKGQNARWPHLNTANKNEATSFRTAVSRDRTDRHQTDALCFPYRRCQHRMLLQIMAQQHLQTQTLEVIVHTGHIFEMAEKIPECGKILYRDVIQYSQHGGVNQIKQFTLANGMFHPPFILPDQSPLLG